MRLQLKGVVLVLVCGMAFGTSASAGDTRGQDCSRDQPEPFALGQPFLINDPRTQLMLYVESDGRHATAITRDGKILWHRNLFDDPILFREILIPPPPFKGEPPVSPEKWRRTVQSYVSKLTIDSIAVEPDCALPFIEKELPPWFRGHYISLSSGTKTFYLLDVKTGDMRVVARN